MVDTAEVIAGVIANEIESTGRFSDAWKRGFQSANRRTVQAQIYSLLKTRISMDLYVTDATGIVQLDSGHPENVGRNFKAYRDVAMTLQGRYGARTSLQESDPKGWILYVAAPIIVKGNLWGVAAVRILDEGPGIPDYALTKIFDRFYSLARPSTGKRSSGLGLCFAREVAHLHHGTVTLRNRSDASGAEALLALAAIPERSL
jgi:C4-dicarboxylate-specific signal transduction histidine kinase